MSERPPANSGEFLARFADALEDAPLDEAETAEALRDLSLSASQVARDLSELVDDFALRARRTRLEEADAARRAALAQLERTSAPRTLSRAQMQGRIRELVKRAGGQAQAQFHRFEAASDEDLARIIEDLEQLVGRSEDDKT